MKNFTEWCKTYRQGWMIGIFCLAVCVGWGMTPHSLIVAGAVEITDEVEEIDLGELDDLTIDEESDTAKVETPKAKAKKTETKKVEPKKETKAENSEEITDDVEEIDLGDLDNLTVETEEEVEEETEEKTVLEPSKKKTEKAEKKTEKTSSGFLGFFTPSSDKKKTETQKEEKTDKKADSDDESRENTSRTQKVYYPLESVIPSDAALIVRIVSVRQFNERLEKMTETNFLKLLKTFGKGEYAKQLEPDRPVGIALFPIQGTFQWCAAVPVKNYRKFAELLGAQAENLPATVPDGAVSVISDTLCIAPCRGHAVLAPNPMIISRVLRGKKFNDGGRYTPCAVKNPTLSIEVTGAMIRFLAQRGRIGMEEFAPVFSPEMLGIQEGSEQMALARQYFDRLNNSIAWLDANVASARVDVSIGKESTIVSTSFLPWPETRLATLLQDPYVPMMGTWLDGRDFLKVAPAYPASLCGQVDIPPATAEQLQTPFNRIRHVEYALVTPPETGRLAEAWCFFLEVNDADAFVKEMIIPKAEEVGGQFGANTLGEIGADLAQQSAERRLERQMNRRRQPRRYADPQQAAARGEAIGGLIGGLIGKSVAKKEAMKVQDFMGHDLYVSDLVQFTQLKKRIQEQQQGIAPPASDMLGKVNPSQMIGGLIQGIANGEANLQMGNMLGGDMLGDMSQENPNDPPMIATRNFILILDPHHLLIVPGNDIILYDAVQRWHEIRDQYLPPEPPKTQEQLAARRQIPPYMPSYETRPPQAPREENSAWHASWNDICNAIATPSTHQVRFANIFSPEETMKTAEYASHIYGFEIPQQVQDEFPRDLPPFLGVYTTSGNAGNTFMTVPHSVSRAQFQKLITNLPLLLAK